VSSSGQSLFQQCLVYLCVVFLISCQTSPNHLPSVEPLATPNQWQAEVRRISNEPAVVEWWKQFEDPMLDQLVRRALSVNYNIQAAVARLSQAKSLNTATQMVRFPTLGLSSQLEREKDGGKEPASIENSFDAGLDLEWELNLFEKKTHQIQLGEQAEVLSESELRAVVLSTIKEVVTSYFQYRGLQKRFIINEQNAELLKASFKLVEARSQAGESSDFDVVRAQGEYQQTFSRLPQLHALKRVALFRLALLTHQTPEVISKSLGTTQPLPVISKAIPIGLPVSLLRQRPDLMVAEAKVDQALSEYQLSVSEIYPSLSLNTSLGMESGRGSKFFDNSSLTWGVGAFFDWSLFAIKARRAQASANYAKTQALMIEYEGAALSALYEVESALEAYQGADQRQERMVALVKSREKSYRIAQELFRLGEVNFISVLDAERELVTSKDEQIVSKVDSILGLVDLMAAIGGGWQAFTPQMSEPGSKAGLKERSAQDDLIPNDASYLLPSELGSD